MHNICKKSINMHICCINIYLTLDKYAKIGYNMQVFDDKLCINIQEALKNEKRRHKKGCFSIFGRS